MPKVWFPTMYMALVQTRRMKPPALSSATFNIPKSMTKTEVKEYLGKIYGMDVKQVNTVNVLGKWMTINQQASLVNSSSTKILRASILPRLKAYRRPNVKRAFVKFMDHEYDPDADD
jgi:ribosomal protein L23